MYLANLLTREHIFPAMILGFLLDQLIGDPAFLYHPVRIIGKLIEYLEKLFRGINTSDKKGEWQAGFYTTMTTVLVSTLLPWLLLLVVFHVNTFAGLVLESFWCCQMLAATSLRKESGKVYDALKKGTLKDARLAVSMIVGRDTASLDEAGVIRAAVETVAENTSDGVVAPLFFIAIGGAAGGFFYKSINTLDSMIGYKNKKYLHFGSFAAHLDDLVNFLPARIAGLLMVFLSGFAGFDRANAWKIFKRDRKKHASPNSAQTEAAMAGALDVRLAGDASYFGKLVHKPTIGDAKREIEAEDIRRAGKLMNLTSIGALILFAAVRLLVIVVTFLLL
uniref:adenosylcobinamide-phosphate synthase CbiB n=1 Tax=Eubacterium cellulosolvens TaxID=29322 RepID=UPI00068791EE|nr:adenosylcobinamide-phosphate synthase CbiB [[Eubacterium] cellulosolvens]